MQRKQSWLSQNPWQAAIVLLLIMWSLNQLLPLLWMCMNSLKSDLDVVRQPLAAVWPPLWQNYPDAWVGESTGVTLGIYFRNSLFIVGTSIVGLMIIATLAAYALGRYSFRGRGVVMLFLIALIAVPMHALIVPLYHQLKALGLTNTYFGLILMYITAQLPFSVLVLQSYFSTFPSELVDAARIDGCTPLGAFRRVVVPIARGAISAVAIVNFISMWNEILLALVILWENDVRPMSVGLLGYTASFGDTRWGLVFAGLSIATVPLILFYLVFHTNIMKGATLGSYR